MKTCWPLIVALACAACSGAAPADPPDLLPLGDRVPMGQLPAIDVRAALAHTKELSSPRFEGRLPGTAGEALTVRYLIDQFQRAGLEPGNPDGTFVQNVPLVGITAAPASLAVKKAGRPQRSLRWREDVVAWTKRVTERAAIANSEVVFVGYGVSAPEFNWDDYKDQDLSGKTLLMLVNDPPVADPSDPSSLDAATFGGAAMTYYGRWTYKFEIGAARGAAAVFLVHETEPAGYPFEVVQGNTGERFDLVTPDRNMSRSAIEGWITLDRAKDLFALAGLDFNALKARAATREFAPVPLGLTVSMTLRNTLRTVASQNVIARIAGADPSRRDEYVVYTAHWDHLGRTAEGTFHGARDNALGCAALIEIARAFKGLPEPPDRTILFLAPTAEEQGLLGSQFYAMAPLYPLARTLANINMDSWNVHGRTTDLTLVGFGQSDLDAYARAAAGEQGRVIRGDPEPGKGFYYRSDHFSFARQGVPALNAHANSNARFVGKDPSFATRVQDEWTRLAYHRPADVVTADWDMSGVEEDLKVYFTIGYRVAQADRYPAWSEGAEFKARRDAPAR